MRLATYTVEDCIRGIGELYRTYGIAFRELSYADWARILNVAYAIINVILEGREPRFFFASLHITQSGQKLPDTFFYPLSFRMRSGGAIARYVAPQEWVYTASMPQSRYRSFSPIYTVWGGLYVPGGVGNPNVNTFGVPYTAGTSPDGVYIYYLPNDRDGTLEYVEIPGFLGITPGFLSNRIVVPYQLCDTFISLAGVLGLIMLNEYATPNAQLLVEFAQGQWAKFAQSVALALGRNLEENPLLGTEVQHDTGSRGTENIRPPSGSPAGKS
jgi:hypothetical protein